MTKKKVGVIIGRFQVPELHEGHKHLLGKVANRCRVLYVILGESGEKDKRNPYSWDQRAGLIRKFYGRREIQLRTITDRDSDMEWSDSIDKMLALYENHDITLYGSRDSFIQYYTGKYPCAEIPELPGYSGTEIRAKLEENAEEK